MSHIETIETTVRQLGGIVAGFEQHPAEYEAWADRVVIRFTRDSDSGGACSVSLIFDGGELATVPSKWLEEYVAAKLNLARIQAQIIAEDAR